MENNLEEQLGHGCERQPEDERDFIFEKTLGAGVVMTDEEWKQGYDIEKEIGFKLPIKNQMTSYSCNGQAWSYYVAVLNAIETGKLDIVSAKAIYSKITLGYGLGSYLRDGGKLVTEFGALLENIVKSHKPDGTTDETWMIDTACITPEITEMAKILQAKEYRTIKGLGIDYFARAIKDGKGMVAGVEGTNNGTWSTNEPKRPVDDTPQGQLWGHALFFGKFGIDEKGKYISTPNSWGTRNEIDGLHPDDWQKLREDWFENNNRWVFNPWTLLDAPNNKNMFTFKKLKGDKNIWICNEAKKTREVFLDMVSMVFFTDTFEEVLTLDDYKIYGTNATIERVILD